MSRLRTKVDWDELARLLEMPSSAAFDERTAQTVRQTERWAARYARPWRGSWRFPADQIEFPAAFERKLHNAHDPVIIIMAATSGWAFDLRSERLWKEERYDEAYILRTYGAALAEGLREEFARELRQWAEENHCAIIARGSPGCGNLPLEMMPQLYDMISRQKEFRRQIHLHDSGLLQPMNSVLTVFAVAKCDHNSARRIEWPCQECALADCRFRRKRKLAHEIES